MSDVVPVIDIAPYFEGDEAGKRQVAAQVDAACADIGFLIIQGHGVPDSLIERMRAVSFAFFDLPTATKQAYKMPPDRYRGYTGLGGEALANTLDEETPPDFKESFSIGPVNAPDDEYHRNATPANFFAPNMWPTEVPDFRETWSAYYTAMENLATSLMRIFALGLGMDEHFFDDKVDRHITNFSAMHYPAQDTPPLKGQLRAGAHTDYGSLTIVRPDDAPGGLQVLNKQGEWADVPYVPGAFVVNLGDLMADWTNDRWVSTMHRVVNPPPEAAGTARRLSFTFFHQPNYDTVIECLPTCVRPGEAPRFSAMTSGEHVWMKVNKHREPALADHA